MIAIICIDDNNGFLFHERRQSRDRELRKNLLEMVHGKRLWMNSYSLKQFEERKECMMISDNFLEHAGSGEYCFIENTDLIPFLNKVEQLVVYSWNTVYPADHHLKLNMEEWELTETIEFPGYSHACIQRNRYLPKKEESK